MDLSPLSSALLALALSLGLIASLLAFARRRAASGKAPSARDRASGSGDSCGDVAPPTPDRSGHDAAAGDGDEPGADPEGYLIALDRLPALIWRTAADGTCDFHNWTWLQFTGRTFAQEHGTSWAEGVHPDDLRPLIERFERAFEARQPLDMVYRLRHRSGKYRRISDHARPIFDSDGGFSGYLGIAFDVTESERAVQALRDSEETFRNIFEAAPVGMARMAPSGRFLLANRAYREMVGYTLDELRSRTVHEITHPDDRRRNEELFERLIRREIPSFEIQKRYARRDGREVWVNKSVSAVFDADGRPVYVQSIIQDVTAQLRDRQALRESEETFRNIFEDATVGMARMDARGRFLLANRAYQQMVGYTLEELRSRTVHEITHPDDRPRNEELFDRLVRREIPSFLIQKRYARPDGREVWVNKSVSAVFDGDGQLVHVQSIIQDVTSQRRDRLALEKREHLLQEAQEIARIGSWEWDLEDDRVQWSDAMYELFGLPSAGDPPSYRGFLELIHPEDRAAVEEDVRRTLDEDIPTVTVFRVVQKNGVVRWLQGRRRMATLAEGGRRLMTGTTQDVTDLKEAEHAVRLLADAGVAFSRSLDFRRAFTAVASLVVPDQADVCGFHLRLADDRVERFAFVHRDPDMQRTMELSVPELPPAGDPSNPVVRAVRTATTVFLPTIDDGGMESILQDESQRTLFHALGIVSAVIVPVQVNGVPAGAMSFLQTRASGRRFEPKDVPLFEELARRAGIALENARLHAGLSEREAQLSEAQAIAHVGNWIWDIESDRIFWSDEMYRMYGYSPGDFELDYGRFLSMVVPEDRTRVDEIVRAAYQRGGPFEFYHGVQQPGGHIRTLHARGQVARDPAGRVVRMLGTAQDVTDIVHAQQALRRSEENYRQLAENVGEMIVRFSPQGRVTYASQAVRTLLGYEPAEVIGREGAEFLHPDDLPRVYEEHRELLHGEEPVPVVCRLLRRDGHPVWVETTARAVRDGTNVESIITVSRDVTESVGAARSTRLLQRVAIVANESETVREAMQTALELVCAHTGWPIGHVYVPSGDERGELSPTDIWHLDDPAAHERFRALTRSIVLLAGQGMAGQVLESGRAKWVRDIREDPTYRLARIPRDLEVRSALAFPVRAGDETLAVMEFFTPTPQEPDAALIELMESVGSQLGEVLRRKRAEHALKGSEERFRALAETATDALVTVDEGGRIIHCNESAERIFGYPCAEMIGRPIAEIMPEQEGVPASGFHRFLGTETLTGRTVETTGRRRDGSTFPVEMSLAQWSSHGATFVTGILRDITERKRAEEALEEKMSELARSNAELALFTYIASHDLREPLRTVGSNLQLLARTLEGERNPDVERQIGFALGGVRRMQALIDDLLLYSRVGTEGRPFDQVETREVVEEAVQTLSVAIAEGGVEMRLHDLPRVRADRTQLVQLFQNLISNAVKFRTLEHPWVDISAALSNGEWVFTVRDNGIGIEERYAEHVFTIFQRLHTQEEYPGTGIGLAVCRKIVERHGGRIWVQPAPGGGSAFRFTIPARGL